MPLHNIRHLGLIPNGFQKEDAPPPTPDPGWQPEVRIRAKPMGDSRHTIEYFNPTTNMEINAPNRSNSYHPAGIEMGREREKAHPKESRSAERELETSPDYERLMRVLYGKERSAGAQPGRKVSGTENHRAGEERVELSEKAREALEQERLQRKRELEAGRSRESYSAGDYYYRRGVEAYRQAQNYARVDNMQIEA